MPPSVVVDASVLVSAFLFPGSIPGWILTSAAEKRFTLYLSPLLLDETRYALLSTRLRASYGYSEESVLTWCDALQRIGLLVQGALPGSARYVGSER